MRFGKVFACATGAAALALAGCHYYSPPPSSLEDNMFVAGALGRVDSQLQLSQMAEQKAHTPSLVAYAKEVAAERALLRDRLAATAQADGVGMDTNGAPHLDTFQPLEGEAFERAYVAAQIEDQRNNLDSFMFEAQNGANPALRKLASAEVPRLQHDLDAAAAIVKTLPFEDESTSSSSTGMGNPAR